MPKIVKSKLLGGLEVIMKLLVLSHILRIHGYVIVLYMIFMEIMVAVTVGVHGVYVLIIMTGKLV